MQNRIYIVGYMGCGKSTVARIVARRLGWEMIDMDKRIEGRFRQTINEIFATRGESGFRKMERNMLEEVCGMENVVISTGGGTPCQSDNMEVMLETGKVVYLRMSAESLAKRLIVTHGTRNRPILKGKSEEELHAFIEEQLAKRKAYYERATHVMDTDGNSAEETATAVINITQEA
ncbi:MAG: shikimate kinase [Paludibacteraceae bacterium]|nr:shikimate kinase [Paludibacteraceae bacterium]